MAAIIDGKKMASDIKEEIKTEVENLVKEYRKSPSLATILVGNNPASEIYVSLKYKACKESGINSLIYRFSDTLTEEELLKKISELNANKEINGILVQLPLPKHINTEMIMEAINYKKDVDGFNPVNSGRLMNNCETLAPCTPKGIILMLEKYNVEIEGSNVVIINHSSVVGKPLALMLLSRNATVTVCHIWTKNLKEHTLKADILISAVGKRDLITEDMVKENAVVIDVGISRVNGKISGDVDFKNVKKKASLITPVPGGVGPMTVAVLLKNTVEAFKMQYKR
ncbi:MAG: bifunctional methylenetetrahydrofolate dehydrogenase/methenyltetrahydrofolate cyclohydrolase FolD [Candidatus Altiarchaeum hamiconexum]|uniref:Bifunctional protein FolD n=1 Tax=Candidatus Altarchaeum hamiconexum TaxID=1803513 RepID=A0A8J7Z2S7_9ARCH|nr:bifunctional methylenetetrahydrofolate dehydrogenase/methenyltetrahydrofolate cyclohydrolase FolD [Candidatus Altarchaeum hamiconexum]OIQ05405.1 MAG: bifunctional methylenetetrahydrofolate dehydrogenase/methenyltetrahydrofolate cyclohydrolase [Candidatus Altarchaeum sp. CG2_30_32_3053]PIV27570.1 MAG: bifunctional methylenetetrahydrofolate dehydrogenase/methenyltetrahydrofolate cyclohydrolase FolD [Candidatus Altarchaeum sp. CG03_land_8_20_14_0_80_32_618]PIX49302.1 MAG: bifunctional methylenet